MMYTALHCRQSNTWAVEGTVVEGIHLIRQAMVVQPTFLWVPTKAKPAQKLPIVVTASISALVMQQHLMDPCSFAGQPGTVLAAA